MKETEKNNGWKFWMVGFMLLPLVEIAAVLPFLPDTVPVHWGIDGMPDRYGSRFELLIPAAILLLVGAVLLISSRKKQPKGVKAGIAATMVIFNIIVPIVLYMTFQPQKNILDLSFGKIVCGLTSIVILIVGNYLPKVSWEYRLKRKCGFHTRYALSSERVWARTQRAAGYAYTAAGLIGIGAAFLLSDFICLIVMLSSMAAFMLITYLYSYFCWKKEEKNEENIRQ